MSPEQLRLECLRLATTYISPGSSRDVISTAKKFADFVTGQRDPRLMTASECEGKAAPTLTVSELAASASD